MRKKEKRARPSLTLRQLYEQAKERDNQKPTEVQLFLADVCRLTLKNESTVRKWLQGARVPPRAVVLALADHFGVDPDTLFTSPLK